MRRWLIIVTLSLLVGAITSVHAQSQASGDIQLYFVTIGDVPADRVVHLVSHFQTKFQIRITILSALSRDPVTFDRERNQLVAEELIAAVRRRYPALARDSRTRVIAITPFDMYTKSMAEQWSFTFSLRDDEHRFAVVSYARMDPKAFREAPNEELLRSRLRKMITKDIGIMYFGMPASRNPKSALFANILGIDDLDWMTEEFEPK